MFSVSALGVGWGFKSKSWAIGTWHWSGASTYPVEMVVDEFHPPVPEIQGLSPIISPLIHGRF